MIRASVYVYKAIAFPREGAALARLPPRMPTNAPPPWLVCALFGQGDSRNGLPTAGERGPGAVRKYGPRRGNEADIWYSTASYNTSAIYSQVITTQPGVVQHVQYTRQVNVNSTCPLVYSIVVAVLCGLMSPITLVCSIPAIVCAALVSHYFLMQWM